MVIKGVKIKPNFAALGREYQMDWRTVKKYYDGKELNGRYRVTVKSEYCGNKYLFHIVSALLCTLGKTVAEGVGISALSRTGGNYQYVFHWLFLLVTGFH